MAAFDLLLRKGIFLCAALAMLLAPATAAAQPVALAQPNIEATLVAEGPAVPGEELMVAIRFVPRSAEWHGYWSNPGDAGYGMTLDWVLPPGWEAGEPLYPVPRKLLISGLMNHIFEGEYAVLVPLKVPRDAPRNGIARLEVSAQWLACTDKICVPESGQMEEAVPLGVAGTPDARFLGWRSAIPPPIDQAARFEVIDDMLRIAIPLPGDMALAAPHVFIENTRIGARQRVAYAAAQRFLREGDTLIAEVPLVEQAIPQARAGADTGEITGVLAFGDGRGVRITARPGAVPDAGTVLRLADHDLAPLWMLLLLALAGGLLLNIMPCVFPVLSLKALTLARAGQGEATARREALAYTAGVVLACLALGGTMLALRAAGEEVGWAFQLQQPGVVVALLVLAVAITANFAGLYQLPGLRIARSGEPLSAFATGLLAAVVATPCTGPFMAAALGASLILPPIPALMLFAALGLGLALPFLFIGFIPAIRERLPKPGPWMERFRKAMALPMGLTALALVWLVSRLGGQGFALVALVLVFGLVAALAVTGRLQRAGKLAWPAFGLIFAPFALFAAFALPASHQPPQTPGAVSLLDHRPFSMRALMEARSEGRPVFVWMTADWCVTCKVNESVAIEREATREAFDRAEVVVLRGDWTRPDPRISSYLAARGAAGVPLYIWYAPGKSPLTLPQVLAPESLVTLAQELPPADAQADALAGGSARSAAPDARPD